MDVFLKKTKKQNNLSLQFWILRCELWWIVVANCGELLVWIVVNCCCEICELWLNVVVNCVEFWWIVVEKCCELWLNVVVNCVQLWWIVVEKCCELCSIVVNCCWEMLWIVIKCCRELWWSVGGRQRESCNHLFPLFFVSVLKLMDRREDWRWNFFFLSIKIIYF